jgi:hypothetical protein
MLVQWTMSTQQTVDLKDSKSLQRNIELLKSDNNFCTISYREVKVTIERIELHVRQVNVSRDVLAAQTKMLEKMPAFYPISHVGLQYKALKPGFTVDSIDISTTDRRIPKRLVFALVSHDAFRGTMSKNCYNFNHFGLQQVSVEVNSELDPHSPLYMDFDAGLFNKAYYSLFNGVDRAALDNGNHITREEFAKGYALFAFDLTPDKANGANFNLSKTGNLTIEFKFKEELKSGVYLIIYRETDRVIEINKERQVIFV